MLNRQIIPFLPTVNNPHQLDDDSKIKPMPRPNISNLRVGHLNVRGLERHIDGIKLLLDKHTYHFFGVTETKLRASVPAGPLRVPDYNLLRHSLPSKGGRGNKAYGGIGLYVQKGVKAVPILKSEHDPQIAKNMRLEYLVVRAEINELKVGVAVIYNPSGANQLFAQQYEKLLIDLLEFDLDQTYLIGDFNINVASSTPSTNIFALNRIADRF